MIRPSAAEWELGADKHGRRVTMRWDEQGCYTLTAHPVSQRDEGEVMRSLSRDVLLNAAAAVTEWKR